MTDTLQAVRLTKANVDYIARCTDVPLADVQAMFEYYSSTRFEPYAILDSNLPEDMRLHALSRETFEKFYRFSQPERRYTFQPIRFKK